MTDQPAPTPTLIANPTMADIHYGVSVSSLGEDGVIIALGHHDDDKARNVFRAHLALDIDEPMRRGWATFRKPEAGEEEYVWITEEVTAGTPGAQPVTYLEF